MYTHDYGCYILVSQSFPPDSTKIRSQLGGWLYAFEIPDALPPPTFRSLTSVPTSTSTTNTTATAARHTDTTGILTTGIYVQVYIYIKYIGHLCVVHVHV